MFLQNATIEYSSESVCFRDSVFLRFRVIIPSNISSNMKLEYIVVYENISDKFSIRHFPDQGQGHCVALKFFSIYRNTNC